MEITISSLPIMTTILNLVMPLAQMTTIRCMVRYMVAHPQKKCWFLYSPLTANAKYPLPQSG